MAGPHPAINPPSLSPPRLAPLALPYHHWDAVSQDPILGDLSPTKTIRAINRRSLATSANESALMKSVDNAANEDKEFCLRVAQACKDLREWAGEVESWEWTATFEPPAPAQRAAVREQLLDMHQHCNLKLPANLDAEPPGFWGSLPIELAQAYETRIDEIQTAMDNLNVEELKNHVKSVHILPSRPKSTIKSRQDEYVGFAVRSVDDFSALITASILQALPYLTWLTRLLNEWSVRLLVLRKVPGFLQGLDDTKARLDAAWDELNLDFNGTTQDVTPLRSKFQALQTVLGSKISALGSRLDLMLDELVGRPETLPMSWIYRFEALEFAYSNWVVRAERTLTGLAWEFDLPSSIGPLTPSYDGLGFITDDQDTNSKALLPTEPFINNESTLSLPSQLRMESPTLGQESFGRVDREASFATIGGLSIRERQNSSFVRLMDDVVSDAHDRPDLSAVPGISAQDFADSPKALPTPPTPVQEWSPDRSSSPARKSPRIRPRHIPINVMPYRDASADNTTRGRLSVSTDHLQPKVPPLPDLNRPSFDLASRRAIFNGDLENRQVLANTQSPVRPFEHATTAFTKLFKPGHVRGHSRSRSASSRNTLKKKSGPNHKSGNSISSKRDSQHSTAGATSLFRHDRKNSTSADLVETTDKATDGDRESIAELVTAPPQEQDWSDKVVVQAPDLEFPDEPRFDSPMTQQLTPCNSWSPQTRDSVHGDGISNPGGPIRSDAFEQMFVDTLPASPILVHDEDPATMTHASFEAYMARLRMSSVMSERNSTLEPRMHDAMIYEHERQQRRFRSEDLLSATGSAGPYHSRSPSRTPEIQEATAAGFSRPQQIISPRSSSVRQKYQPLEESKPPISISSPVKDMRATNKIAEESDRRDSGLDHVKAATKRASKETGRPDLRLSIFPAPPQEIQSARSTKSTKSTSSDADMSIEIISFRESRNRSGTISSEETSFPLPPNRPMLLHARNTSADPTAALPRLRTDSERHPTGQDLTPTALRTLPLADLTPDRAHGPSAPLPPTPKERDTPISFEEKMDRRVGHLVESMATNIDFTPAPKYCSARASLYTPMNSAGRLILAPANPPEHKPKQNMKDDDRIYHLCLPGRAQPLKLNVKLSGSQQTVMVRRGGGYSELEEYLADYANHHAHELILPDRSRARQSSKPPSNRKSSKSTSGLSHAGDTSDLAPPPLWSSSPDANSSMIAHVDGPETYSSPPSQRSARFDSQRSTRKDSYKSYPLFPKVVTTSGTRRSASSSSGDSNTSRRDKEEQKALWIEQMKAQAQDAMASSDGNKRSSWQALGTSGSVRRVALRNTSSPNLLD